MHSLRKAVLLALATVSMAPAGAATFAATVRASSGTSSLAGPIDTTDRRGPSGWQLDAVSAVQQQVGGGDGQGNASARAWVLPGGLQLRADAGGSSAVVTGQMAASGAGTASGSVDDAFTLLVPGCSNTLACGAGRKGFMSFAVLVEGGYGGGGSRIMDGSGTLAGWSVSGGWTADVRLDAGFISSSNTDPTSASWSGGQSRSETSTSGPVVSGTGSFGLRTFTVAFVFGRAISVHLAGSVSATSNNTAFVGSPAGFANASAQSAFLTDLSHTIGWAGISEVRDASGQPLTGWTALSSSTGFDYARPYVAAVPEPAGWMLLAGGLAWTLGRRRFLARS